MEKMQLFHIKSVAMKKIIFGIILIVNSIFIGKTQDLTASNSPTVIDGIYTKSERQPLLNEPYLNERDVLWEKRIWRELDLREKMNHHFSNQKEPLALILLNHAKSGSLTVYSNIDDAFTTALSVSELNCMTTKYDSVIVYDPDNYSENVVVVKEEFNPQHVIRYRIKEVWYFDSKLSRMNVRILGIAPIVARFDDNGKYIGETPLFWVFYPKAREILTDYKVFNAHNEAAQMNWDDIFQIRYFSSYIVKENNVHDRRIKDYKVGVDVLYEAEAIQTSMFNYEQDIWEK
jgi:gliding motility associated protien GldN